MIKGVDIKDQKLLGDLDAKELDRIAGSMKLEPYEKGTLVFGEGTPTKGIFLIRKGRVEIAKTTADGWKHTLAVLAEQNFFGELSVIEDRKVHSTNATALDDTELYRIPTEDFKRLERDEPQILYKVMKTIARMASRNVHTMNEKLIKALISY
ncbi:MAG: cyclic nucleotide-binding domain-containing protein [Nitrospiraceae bacterium]|nr:cyclic nucleotide-binding domain-containing protein [Nitrospiraceae bacterium]